MKNPLVSVIIPVRNGESYILDILRDFLAQSLSDFEVLVVDNGSTDRTWEVACRFQKERKQAGDLRFFPYREHYEGVSAARNRGLALAKGEYVVFVDGDDAVSPDYLATLVGLMRQGVLLGACGYETYVEKSKNIGEKKQFEKIKESPVEEPAEKSVKEMLLRLFATKYYEGFVWNKIFVRKLIEEEGLWFDEEVFFNEDRLFVFTYLLAVMERKGPHSTDVLYSPSREYRYRIHNASAMEAFRGGDVVSEKEVTEFLAFLQMEWALVEYLSEHGELEDQFLDLRFALQQDMVQSELRCFKRMIGTKHIFRYRNSAMRYFAKNTKGIDYQPQGMYEDVLLSIFRRYGWSGCTYTRNPELFSEIGIL